MQDLDRPGKYDLVFIPAGSNCLITDTPKISDLQKSNRKIFIDALQQVGFANYAGEYWHWLCGDRYEAYIHSNSYAIYGTVAK